VKAAGVARDFDGNVRRAGDGLEARNRVLHRVHGCEGDIDEAKRRAVGRSRKVQALHERADAPAIGAARAGRRARRGRYARFAATVQVDRHGEIGRVIERRVDRNRIDQAAVEQRPPAVHERREDQGHRDRSADRVK
jgi:hypothetical protein